MHNQCDGDRFHRNGSFFMKKILRFILTVVVMGVFIGLTMDTDYGAEPLVGVIFAGFAFSVFWDLLEFLSFSDFTDRLRQILFYLCVVISFVFAFAASFQELFGEYAEYYSTDFLGRVLICGSMPGCIATLWLGTLADYYDLNRGFAPFIMVGGFIVGSICGLVIQVLSMVGSVMLLVIQLGVSGVGVFFLVKFIKEHGFIFNTDGAGLPMRDSSPSYTPTRSSTRSSGYSSSSYDSYSSSSGYGEGLSQLQYQMQDIAYRHTTSRNLPFGIGISSDISCSVYNDECYFTANFTIDTTGCDATNQREADMALNDAHNFQKEIMNDLFRDGKNLLTRLRNKYPELNGVSFEVKVGNINQY